MFMFYLCYLYLFTYTGVDDVHVLFMLFVFIYIYWSCEGMSCVYSSRMVKNYRIFPTPVYVNKYK
jgi:hypothetical protein